MRIEFAADKADDLDVVGGAHELHARASCTTRPPPRCRIESGFMGARKQKSAQRVQRGVQRLCEQGDYGQGKRRCTRLRSVYELFGASLVGLRLAC